MGAVVSGVTDGCMMYGEAQNNRRPELCCNAYCYDRSATFWTEKILLQDK